MFFVYFVGEIFTMKHSGCLVFILLLLFCSRGQAFVLSGNYTIPGNVEGTTVNNLTQLASVLNANTVNGSVVFEFTSAYTTTAEVFPIIFVGYSGTGKVVIRPAASVSTPLLTSGQPVTNALIQFSGVRHLTIDGRPGGTGDSVRWQFQNTAVNGTYPAFLFINGAVYDTLQYLNILSSGSANTSTVLFSSSTVAGGNSYNTVQNCNIGNYLALPYNPVQSISSEDTSRQNHHLSFLNNTIYNFQGTAISIYSGSWGNCRVSGNSIYSPHDSIVSTSLCGIYVMSDEYDLISGNYIGGTQPRCGGNRWQVKSSLSNAESFTGIKSRSYKGNITENTIANIAMRGTSGPSTFIGIYSSTYGIVSSNIIGDRTPAKSIVSGNYGTLIGIWADRGPLNVDENIITGLHADGSAYTNPPTTIVSGCTMGIGNTDASITCKNNVISDFSRADNYNSNNIYKIEGNDSVQYNIIAGIALSGSNTQYVYNNTIYNLRNALTGSVRRANLYGVAVTGSTSAADSVLISRNLVYGLHAPDNFGASPAVYAGITGIYSTAPKNGRVDNNFISIGTRPTDSSVIYNANVRGLYVNCFTNSNMLVMHNSVYITGILTNNLNSAVFAKSGASGNIKNNIFVNDVTTTGTGKNYGIIVMGSVKAEDYNNVYGTGASYYYASTVGADYITQLAYSSVTNREVHGLSVNPAFINPHASPPDLHLEPTTAMNMAGTDTITAQLDFDNRLRSNYTPVDIGAAVVCTAYTPAAQVGITASADTVCTADIVTITATGSNTGNSPVFWLYINSIPVQSNNTGIFSRTFGNNDSVVVVMQSGQQCSLNPVAYSNSIKFAVLPGVTVPAVSLQPGNDTACAGAPVVFTATAINGGNAPVYSFYINGQLKQASTSATFTATTLNNKDSVWVVLTSNAACLAVGQVTSPKVYMVIKPLTPSPTVFISGASESNYNCAGATYQFVATATNAGTTPVYTWLVNGDSVGTNSTHYYTNTLTGGEQVKVILKTGQCVAVDSVSSNTLTAYIVPNVTPIVGISISPGVDICAGTPVAFMPYPVNQGANPAYRWYKNGVQVSTSANYYAGVVANGDVFRVKMISSANCAQPDTASSINLTVNVTAIPVAVVTVQGNTLATDLFDTYQWYRNGQLISGANAQVYAATQSGNYFVVVSNAGCDDTSATVNFVYSGLTDADNIGITVYPNPTTDKLNLVAEMAEAQTLHVRLYDVFGNLVLSRQLQTTAGQYHTVLPLTSYATGIYLLQVNTPGGTFTRRVELLK